MDKNVFINSNTTNMILPPLTKYGLIINLLVILNQVILWILIKRLQY